MSKLAARNKRVKRTVSIGRVAPETVEQVADLDSRIEAIQWLIPLGLKAVTEELQRAVIELAGPRSERKESDQPLRRWGFQPGSVYLGDQKLPVEVPRVRDVDSDTFSRCVRIRPCRRLGKWTRGCCCACLRASPRATTRPALRPYPRPLVCHPHRCPVVT